MGAYLPMQLTTAGQTLYAKVQSGTALTFTRCQIGSGETAASAMLNQAIAQGTAYTALTVNALSGAIGSGSTLTIAPGQTVTTSASVSAGATSIPVTSFTSTQNVSSGTSISIAQNWSTYTGLITPVSYFNINSIVVNSATALINAIFQNTNISTATYTCEIGLYAQDPTAGEILYAYANAGANGDTIPPISSGPASWQFPISVSVGNAMSVTANIPAGTYVPQSEVGQASGVASLDANGDVPQSELGYVTSMQADLFGNTSVVLSGGVATKDGTTATQLDVTVANVYFGTGQHMNFAASTSAQFMTSVASTTYYLDYNLDGTTSWGTVHSTQTGYVPICSVATDANGNISTVTDARPTTIELFHAATAVDGSKMTTVPAANLVGGPIPAAVLPPANSTTPGILESAQNPASGDPIAVITNPASQAGQSINGPLTVTDLSVAGMTGAQTQSRYVGAVSGAAPTTGTFDVGDFVIDVTNLTLWICTAAGSPGTWSNFNYLRLDANAPNPQTVTNSVTFGNSATFTGNNGRVTFSGRDTSNSMWFTTGLTTEPQDLFLGYATDSSGNVTQVHLGGGSGATGQSIVTPKNTLDDGSGNATFAGSVTVGGTILNQHVESPGQNGVEILAAQSGPTSGFWITTSTTDTVVATFTATYSGGIRYVNVSFELSNANGTGTSYGYVSVNGVATTTQTETSNYTNTYTQTLDLGSVTTSFTVELHVWNPNGGEAGINLQYLYGALRGIIVSGT